MNNEFYTISTCIHSFEDARILGSMINCYNSSQERFDSLLKTPIIENKMYARRLMSNISIVFSDDMTAQIVVPVRTLEDTGIHKNDVTSKLKLMLTLMIVYHVTSNDESMTCDIMSSLDKLCAFYKAYEDFDLSGLICPQYHSFLFKTAARIIAAITYENCSGRPADPVEACTIQAAVQECEDASSDFAKEIDEIERKTKEMMYEAMKRRDLRKADALKIIIGTVSKVNAPGSLASTAANYIVNRLRV